MRISDWSSDVCSSDLKITWDAALADVAAALGFVAGAVKAAVVGYCWGGSVAWLAACRHNLAAAACYYGGNIHECRNETPTCPVMFHFGAEDASIPMDQGKEIGAALQHHEHFHLHIGPGLTCAKPATQ